MSDESEVLCRACRLVQAKAARCAACGGDDLVSQMRIGVLMRPVVRLKLSLYELTFREVWGGFLALLLTVFGVRAGAPWFVLAAILMAAVVLSTHVAVVRARLPVEPVALPAPAKASPAAEGVARVRGTPVRAAISGHDALAVSTTVSSARNGKVYFRRFAATELWVESDAGERVLVSGEVWVDAPATAAPSALTRRTTGEMLALVGVAPLAIDEPLTVDEWAVYPGQRVAAFGELRREPIAGDGYREQLGLVLRGAPGAPIRLRAL